MESNQVLTMSGLTWEQAIAKLKETLPESAYKKVEGSAFGGTDISPAWLTEKANEIFGPCGVGWTFTYEQSDALVSRETRNSKAGREYSVWSAWLTRLELRILWLGFEGIDRGVILSTGYAEGENPAYALRGAVTNALGSAFSKLCWQVGVYKGERDGFQQASGGAQASGAKRQAQQATSTPVSRPYPPETVLAGLEQKLIQYVKESKGASDKQVGLLAGMLQLCFAGDPDAERKAHTVLAYLTRGTFTSTREISRHMALAMLDWLKISEDSGGALSPDPMAAKEAQAIVVRRLSELGQESLFPSG